MGKIIDNSSHEPKGSEISCQNTLNNPEYELRFPRLDTIFFIYTGTIISKKSYAEWRKFIDYSADYAEAKAKRDAFYNKLLEEN